MFERPVFDSQAATDPLVGRVAGITAALDHITDQEVWQSGDESLLWGLAEIGRARRLLEALQLRILADAKERGSSLSTTGASTTSWMREKLGMTRPAAAGEISFARSLHGHPVTLCAVETAAITTGAARVVLSVLNSLPSTVAPDQREEAERVLVEQAAVLSTPELVKAGRYLRDVLDPDGADRRARDEDDAVEGRELFLNTDDRGILRLRGRLDPESGLALRTALDAFAAPNAAADGAPDPRSAARRNADALTQLALGVLDGGGLPTSGGNRPHLSITIPLAALSASPTEDRSWLPSSEFGLHLSPAAIRRLACDAKVVPIVLGTKSEPLDVGRAAYVVPTGMRRALVARDRTCAFPDCSRPPGWCHAHHIHHWEDGGDTRLSNLVLLCGEHHRAVHHTGWDVRMGKDLLPTFVPPTWIDPTRTPRRNDWRHHIDLLAHPG